MGDVMSWAVSHEDHTYRGDKTQGKGCSVRGLVKLGDTGASRC